MFELINNKFQIINEFNKFFMIEFFMIYENLILSLFLEKADETKISQRPYDIAENIHSICNFSDDQSV